MPRKRTMLWIFAGLAGVLIALLVIVVVVGGRLPETYTAYGTVQVDLPPDALWKELVDCERYPRAAKMAKSVERLPDVDGKPSWREDLGASQVTWTVVEWEAPRSA